MQSIEKRANFLVSPERYRKKIREWSLKCKVNVQRKKKLLVNEKVQSLEFRVQ